MDSEILELRALASTSASSQLVPSSAAIATPEPPHGQLCGYNGQEPDVGKGQTRLPPTHVPQTPGPGVTSPPPCSSIPGVDTHLSRGGSLSSSVLSSLLRLLVPGPPARHISRSRGRGVVAERGRAPGLPLPQPTATTTKNLAGEKIEFDNPLPSWVWGGGAGSGAGGADRGEWVFFPPGVGGSWGRGVGSVRAPGPGAGARRQRHERAASLPRFLLAPPTAAAAARVSPADSPRPPSDGGGGGGGGSGGEWVNGAAPAPRPLPPAGRGRSGTPAQPSAGASSADAKLRGTQVPGQLPGILLLRRLLRERGAPAPTARAPCSARGGLQESGELGGRWRGANGGAREKGGRLEKETVAGGALHRGGEGRSWGGEGRWALAPFCTSG
ncbi:translation initiation factor IF-2-like [Antechinus flavipes]|uniref:translation initiation factor IF-2-like n=1 Tax=Antechinus flavipes TaxID=38775 RepID=UPI002236B2AB|nr:translation initiation factor IF-2-like [Antechinus flavipes]